jgi:hypothetical protein
MFTTIPSAPARAPYPDPAILAHAALASIPNACAFSGFSRTRLYDLKSAGVLRFVKIGRCSLVDMQSLRDFIADLPTAATRSGRFGITKEPTS